MCFWRRWLRGILETGAAMSVGKSMERLLKEDLLGWA
jgi:hypothetical protein